MRAWPRLLAACAASASLTALVAARQAAPFVVEETTIAQIHAAMKAGALTCRSLVEQYLRRIDAYDKNGPALNAIVIVNPDALAEADDLDRRFKSGGPWSAPLRADDRQGQLRDHRPAKRRGIALAQGIRLESRRFPGAASQTGWRPRDREVEHGGVRVHAVRNGQFDSAGLHEESLRPGSRHRRLERWDGRRGRGQLRRRGPGQRYRQLHPRPVVSPGARRDSFDDGVDEPERRRPAQPARGHRGPDCTSRSRTPLPSSKRSSGRTPTTR